VHHLTFRGHTLMTREGHRTAGISLIGGTMTAADMVADNVGEFVLSSAAVHSTEQGLLHTYTVLPRGLTPASPILPFPTGTGTTRRYFISADEVAWDYVAPFHADMCLPPYLKPGNGAFTPEPEGDRFDVAGVDMNGFPAGGRVFVRRHGHLLGSTYRKAQVRRGGRRTPQCCEATSLPSRRVHGVQYRDYTDATFTVQSSRSAASIFPALRAAGSTDTR